MEYIQANTYMKEQGEKMSDAEKEGKLPLGQFICVDKPVYEGTNMPL